MSNGSITVNAGRMVAMRRRVAPIFTSETSVIQENNERQAKLCGLITTMQQWAAQVRFGSPDEVVVESFLFDMPASFVAAFDLFIQREFVLNTSWTETPEQMVTIRMDERGQRNLVGASFATVRAGVSALASCTVQANNCNNLKKAGRYVRLCVPAKSPAAKGSSVKKHAKQLFSKTNSPKKQNVSSPSGSPSGMEVEEDFMW